MPAASRVPAAGPGAGAGDGSVRSLQTAPRPGPRLPRGAGRRYRLGMLRRSTALSGLLACLTPACGTLSGSTSPGGPPLPLDTVFELSRSLRAPSGLHDGWLGGSAYLATEREEDEPPRLVRVEAATGATEPLFDSAAMAAAFEGLEGVTKEDAASWSRRTRYSFDADHRRILLDVERDLFCYHLDEGRAVRLTDDDDDEVGATFSPDGSWISFARNDNLWVVPSSGGEQRALTTEGHADLLHGRLDWVYQEEVYGRGNFQANWWSPDGSQLAYMVLDESGVPEYTIVDLSELHSGPTVWRYPKPGDPNPKATLHVVPAGGGDSVALDLSRYAGKEFLIVRVGWTPDGSKVVFQVQNRIQTWLDLCLGDPATGETQRLFRERTQVWTEPTDAPYWIQGGERFLWLSERDGWKHLYLYERDGRLVRQVTSGEWEVDAYHDYDEDSTAIYYSGDEADVKGRQLYRINLDGGGRKALTKRPGTHQVSVSKDLAYFVDRWSSAGDPGDVTLRRIDGALVRSLAEVDEAPIAKYGLRAPRFFTVPTRDGFDMEAMLIEPADFDPSERYPVICYTYAGPHASQVRNAWMSFNMLFHQMLAQEGYLIWVCDNRTASGKGLKSVAPAYENLGETELSDIEDGLDWLVGRGWADPDRIGIWGWSYGGYMTSYALTHSERFKVGIAGAPVTDWRLYDSIYTERYMNTPEANPEGYAKSSVIEAAADLSGQLLVIHGTQDENVHMQNTLRLANALQKAGKAHFDMMLYPGNRHGIVQPAQRRHLYEMMAAYFREHL